MQTRWLLTTTAMVCGVFGVGLTFAPQEALAGLGEHATGPLVVLAQLAGALYLSMGVLAWLSRALRVGGIYARPLALANALHFFVGATTLLRMLAAGETSVVEIALAACYVVLALWWGATVFTSPV